MSEWTRPSLRESQRRIDFKAIKDTGEHISFESLLTAAKKRGDRQEAIRSGNNPAGFIPEPVTTPPHDNFDDLILAGRAEEILRSPDISGALRGLASQDIIDYANRDQSEYDHVISPVAYETLTHESVTRRMDSLIGVISDLAERFYEGTNEVYHLGQRPTVMFKPRDESPHTAIDLIAHLKRQNWIVFYTDGTIVSIPKDEESFHRVMESAWNMFYIGVGLPKGFNQGVAEPHSSGIIRSSDPSGKDKRVYSDVGYSAAIAARRGLGKDMIDRKDAPGQYTSDIVGYSMADNSLPIPEDTEEQPVIKRKVHHYVGRRVVNGGISQAFEGIDNEYFERVRARVDYPLSLNNLQWRDISNFAECIVDTIDSTDDVFQKPVNLTEYRLRLTMALFRSFQTITENFWTYLYGQAYNSKHPNPLARRNPIGYQIYGESIKLQFEDMPDVMVGNISATKYLNTFIERSVQRMDKILCSVTDKRLQPSLLRHPNYKYNFNGSDSTDHSFEGLMVKVDAYIAAIIDAGGTLTSHQYKEIIQDVLKKTTFMYNGYIQSSPHIDDEYEASAAKICKEIIEMNALNNNGRVDEQFSTDVYLITDDFLRLLAPR